MKALCSSSKETNKAMVNKIKFNTIDQGSETFQLTGQIA